MPMHKMHRIADRCYIIVNFGNNRDIVVNYDNNPFWISVDTNNDDLE